jgi:hypothetical protein
MVNGLNSPIKRHRLAEWIGKQGPTVCFLQETCFIGKDSWTESERMENYTLSKWKLKASRRTYSSI